MSKNEPQVSGYCDSKFEKVKEIFIQNFTQRNELGACVCVYKDGEKVVDLWVVIKIYKKQIYGMRIRLY